MSLLHVMVLDEDTEEQTEVGIVNLPADTPDTYIAIPSFFGPGGRPDEERFIKYLTRQLASRSTRYPERPAPPTGHDDMARYTTYHETLAALRAEHEPVARRAVALLKEATA